MNAPIVSELAIDGGRNIAARCRNSSHASRTFHPLCQAHIQPVAVFLHHGAGGIDTCCFSGSILHCFSQIDAAFLNILLAIIHAFCQFIANRFAILGSVTFVCCFVGCSEQTIQQTAFLEPICRVEFLANKARNVRPQTAQSALNAASFTATAIPGPCNQVDNGLDRHSTQREQSLSDRLTALHDNIADSHDKLSQCIAYARCCLRNAITNCCNNSRNRSCNGPGNRSQSFKNASYELD